MMQGKVNRHREATLRLVVRGQGAEQEIEAVIDTGFDGYLTLPAGVIAALGLRWRSRGGALLADGSGSIFEIYEGTVLWDGSARRILIHGVETMPLLGMGLLEGYALRIEVRQGGSVVIDSL